MNDRAQTTHPGAVRSLTIMTVNVHMGFAAFRRRLILSGLRDAVRAVGADIVCLQEVLGTHAGHAATHRDWPDAPHHEYLAEAMWPQFAYGRNAVYPEGHHGNALLSKYPIVRHANHDVSIDAHARHPDRVPEKRGLLHCTLEVPALSRPLHVVCAHLGLSEAHRRRQLDLLCATVRSEVPVGEPLIVAGDFNDWRQRAHAILADGAGLREVFVEARGVAARTFPARLPLLRLDRIYVRDAEAHAPVTLPRKPWSHLSDHAPLAARVDLRP